MSAAPPDPSDLVPQDPDATWSRFHAATRATAFAWIATAILLAGPWLGDGERRLLTDVLLILFPIPGAIFAGRNAKLTRGRLRFAWRCFTATSSAWTLGNVVWFYYQFIAAAQPFPTAADFFYMVALASAVVGLVAFPVGDRNEADKTRLLIDGWLILLSILLLSYVTVLEAVFTGLGTDLGSIVYATYPVADVLIASLAILLLSRTSGFRPDLLLLGLGLLVYAVGDTGYALLAARGEFRIGTPVDLGWLGGYLLVGLAALVPAARRTATGSLRPASTSAVADVLVYSTAGLGILAWALAGSDNLIEKVMGGLLLVLLGVRQAVLAHDNRALRLELEERVAERTAELEMFSTHHVRILDAVGEGIYGIDSTGRLTFVNPAAGRLTRRTLDELIGADAHTVFHAVETMADPRVGQASCLGCNAVRSMSDPDSIRTSDAHFVDGDGHRFAVELTATPMLDDGVMSGAVVVFSDISERRAVERMKEEFISVVSHELRTPLTAIRGSLGLLAGGAVGSLQPRASHMVGIALDNSERLTRLINDILDMERLESGAIPLQIDVLDASELVAKTITAMDSVAQTAGLRLVQQGKGGRVHGDADRIVQALTNLIGNAIKFSPPGEEITVTAQRVKARVVFGVQDRGRGVPDEMLESIFERFQQVDSSDARDKGGTGLGLPITKAIVNRHGGRIWAERAVGGGTIFKFTLPATLEPLQATMVEDVPDERIAT